MVYDDGYSCHLKWIIMTTIADLNQWGLKVVLLRIIVVANDMQGWELPYSMSYIAITLMVCLKYFQYYFIFKSNEKHGLVKLFSY